MYPNQLCHPTALFPSTLNPCITQRLRKYKLVPHIHTWKRMKKDKHSWKESINKCRVCVYISMKNIFIPSCRRMPARDQNRTVILAFGCPNLPYLIFFRLHVG